MIEKTVFGRINDRIVNLYTLTNLNKMSVSIMDLGGTIVSINVPNSKGNVEDVVLGFKEVTSYLNNGECIGCVVVPNANRIAGGLVKINGDSYQLILNDGGRNNLHTDIKLGCALQMMDVSLDKDEITFSCEFKDGLANLPGNRKFSVTYRLTRENELEIEYKMISDKDTIFNPTQHTYFNLAGHNSGDIKSQYLKINADYFTPVDKYCIPTGELRKVDGTAFDFRELKQIGQDFNLTDSQLSLTNGYDHNFCINEYDGTLKEAAKLYDKKSGRLMICKTTQPGMQIYTANYLDRKDGKNDATYLSNHGVCLETQFYPDCLNHQDFPKSYLKANQEVVYKTVYQFMW